MPGSSTSVCCSATWVRKSSVSSRPTPSLKRTMIGSSSCGAPRSRKSFESNRNESRLCRVRPPDLARFRRVLRSGDALEIDEHPRRFRLAGVRRGALRGRRPGLADGGRRRRRAARFVRHGFLSSRMRHEGPAARPQLHRLAENRPCRAAQGIGVHRRAAAGSRRLSPGPSRDHAPECLQGARALLRHGGPRESRRRRRRHHGGRRFGLHRPGPAPGGETRWRRCAPEHCVADGLSVLAIDLSMKLYITSGSPYQRMAREKKLESRIEIVFTKTRVADSPYYAINPSGRVPYLVRDDGVGMEESALICDYLDRLDGRPAFELPPGSDGLEARRLEALARSLVDGLSVWNRELARPVDERSPGVIRHETGRARRMVELWEKEIGHAYMRGPLNMAQLTLGVALGLELRSPDFLWRAGHPKLAAWYERLAARPSFAAPAPPRA